MSMISDGFGMNANIDDKMTTTWQTSKNDERKQCQKITLRALFHDTRAIVDAIKIVVQKY